MATRWWFVVNIYKMYDLYKSAAVKAAGDTVATNAQEALLLHLEGLLDGGKPIPKPSEVGRLRRKREFRNWTWAIADVDMSRLGDKAARMNITLPRRILRAVDAHARRHGETRSGFLARAALDAMCKQG
jgi:hypothetical protein